MAARKKKSSKKRTAKAAKRAAATPKKRATKRKASKKRAAKKRTSTSKASKKKAAKKRPSTSKASKKKAAKKRAAGSKVSRKRAAKKRSTRTAPAESKRAAARRSRRKPRIDLAAMPDDAVVILAVRGMVLFPGVVLRVVIGREKSIRAVQAAVQSQRPIGLLVQTDADDLEPEPSDLYTVGTQAEILRYITAPDGTHHAVVQGQSRFRVVEFLTVEPFLTARIETFPDDEDESSKEIEARFLHLKNLALSSLDHLPERPHDLDQAIQNASSPAMLADLVATFIDLKASEKQEILETIPLAERLDKVAEKLSHVAEVLKLSSDIREQTKETLDKAQREYFLREQLRTIQAELGEGISVEARSLEEQITQAEMPAAVAAEARKELKRLERMPEAAMEASMVRTYLEWLLELPWNKSTQDSIDIARARAILNEDHYGLDKVKQRILEFLAVRKLKPDGKGPILCLVGPPGVGKTSLGQSVARAMARKFVRISLGGVHDESEIRGHRRTYVGALPGSIIQSLRRAEANNPVFMLDEMDKLGKSFQGDPASALLEVLDPAQNRDFTDHYLNVPFDLSRVLFIGTANVLDQIPGPLRDRCEVIELTGYTEEEKLQIAKRYLVARQREESGLNTKQLSFTDAALRKIIHSYTREAGCRSLERTIGAVARYAATRVASGKRGANKIDTKHLAAILGPPKFESELALRTSVPGVATGLAWTPVGGELLFVEATLMPGKGEFILTGQLGDVMKESARAAVTLIRSRASELDVDPELFAKNDIHVHVPAGAIPKDGPSAGVAMYTALMSLLTGRRVRSDIAMTGEISLRGLVLPVGGIKDKVLAAHRAGIRTVLLPRKNQKDEEEIPASARAELELRYLDRVGDALELALEPRRSNRAGRGSSTGVGGLSAKG